MCLGVNCGRRMAQHAGMASTSGHTPVVGEFNKLFNQCRPSVSLHSTPGFHTDCASFQLQPIIHGSSRTICMTLTRKRVFTKSNRLPLPAFRCPPCLRHGLFSRIHPTGVNREFPDSLWTFENRWSVRFSTHPEHTF